MKHHIIREISAESAKLSFYFDGDTFNANAGNYCYTLFIVSFDHGRVYGFNTDEYERIQSQATEVSDGFTDVQDGYLSCTYKEIMQDCGIHYSPTKCHKLKEWSKHNSPDDTDGIAAFLSILTGKKWECVSCSGYSQGDYCEVIYCPSFNSADIARECGDIWLGCAKEFSVTHIDNDGNELYTAYGYIVADCKAWKDEDYKKIVCEWAGINPDDSTMEMIDGCTTQTIYSYRTVS